MGERGWGGDGGRVGRGHGERGRVGEIGREVGEGMGAEGRGGEGKGGRGGEGRGGRDDCYTYSNRYVQ